jgi:sulfide:quinone oxidoreductase
MERFPLADIAADQHAAFRLDALTSVDGPARRVRLRGGEWLSYDALVMATGATAHNAVPGATLFHGRGGTNDLAAALDSARQGRIGRLAFAVPAGVSWPLPLYELALLSAWRLAEDGVSGVAISFVTPEREPLELFGAEAGRAVRALFAEREVELLVGTVPAQAGGGRLELAEGGHVPADATFTVPRLEGRRTIGLPAGPDGFIPVDAHGRVSGLEDVYVVGDGADYPVKQGGLATQQADAAAEAIAARLGLHDEPQPFRPVLRATLLTGSAPLYLSASLCDDETPPEVAERPSWPEPGKVAGRHLGPYLAELERWTG